MTIESILGAIVIGAVIGAIGRLLLPGKQAIGWILTIVVGIVAALLGTLLAQVLGVETTPGIDWIELVMQVVLAIVGVGLHPFGRFAGVSGIEMGAVAIRRALADAGGVVHRSGRLEARLDVVADRRRGPARLERRSDRD